MKKGYSDPLMFSNVLLTGPSIGPSQGGGFGPKNDVSKMLRAAGNALSTPTDSIEGTDNTAGNDIQIVDPSQMVDKNFTEADVQSVIDDISPAGTTEESTAVDTTGIAE